MISLVIALAQSVNWKANTAEGRIGYIESRGLQVHTMDPTPSPSSRVPNPMKIVLPWLSGEESLQGIIIIEGGVVKLEGAILRTEPCT